MGKSPLTRIAVNLSLIVALAIQPMAIAYDVSWRSGGGAKSVGCSAQSDPDCHGCGCCQVNRADELCCCCTDAASPVEIGPSEGESRRLSVPACEFTEGWEDDQSEEQGQPEGLGKQPQVAEIGQPAGIRSLCRCEQRHEPLSDSTPRRPTTEKRELHGAAVPQLAIIHSDSLTPSSLLLTRVPVPLPLHFSQICLGIWRL